MNFSYNKFIMMVLLIINIKFQLKINELNRLLQKRNLKQNLNNQNNFYKEMLKLYIEDREKFYLKGREYAMKNQGKQYNESKLETIQDKLNYLLIHESPEKKTEFVDKILVKNYSKKMLNEDIAVPILKIYNNASEINLDDLPDKFILKCNHGSGMNILCKDKNKFNLTKAVEKLNKWMNINYGLQGFEYQYLNVKKKIFAEKFLDDNIIDYKFNCFNGEPKFIRTKIHINGKNINNHYSLNWTLTDIDFNWRNYVRDPSIIIEKPKNLDKMIYYAKLLSSPFCFCRVDFYEVGNKVYLGELTFAPANLGMNYNDEKKRKYLGNLLDISKIKK